MLSIKIFPCLFCLYRFTVEETLEKHIPDWGMHLVQGVSYPSSGYNIIHFRNIANQMKVSFATFADFERYLEKYEIQAGKPQHLLTSTPQLVFVALLFNPSSSIIRKSHGSAVRVI